MISLRVQAGHYGYSKQKHRSACAAVYRLASATPSMYWVHHISRPKCMRLSVTSNYRMYSHIFHMLCNTVLVVNSSSERNLCGIASWSSWNFGDLSFLFFLCLQSIATRLDFLSVYSLPRGLPLRSGQSTTTWAWLEPIQSIQSSSILHRSSTSPSWKRHSRAAMPLPLSSCAQGPVPCCRIKPMWIPCFRVSFIVLEGALEESVRGTLKRNTISKL